MLYRRRRSAESSWAHRILLGCAVLPRWQLFRPIWKDRGWIDPHEMTETGIDPVNAQALSGSRVGYAPSTYYVQPRKKD